MTTAHLSEEAIQWYAEANGRDPAVTGRDPAATILDPTVTGAANGEPGPRDIITHMLTCEACQARVAVYQELFAAIGQQPEASFDFDLAQAVLSQLSPAPAMQVITTPSGKATSSPHYGRWLIPLMVAAAGAPIYIFRKDILEMFKGLSSMLIYLSVITVLSLVVFQGIETYKKYQRKMEALNLY